MFIGVFEWERQDRKNRFQRGQVLWQLGACSLLDLRIFLCGFCPWSAERVTRVVESPLDHECHARYSYLIGDARDDETPCTAAVVESA